MNGIQMMLKAMGFDPDTFMAQVNEAKTTAGKVIENFDARLEALEEGQARIEAILKAMAKEDVKNVA